MHWIKINHAPKYMIMIDSWGGVKLTAVGVRVWFVISLAQICQALYQQFFGLTLPYPYLNRILDIVEIE